MDGWIEEKEEEEDVFQVGDSVFGLGGLIRHFGAD